MIAIGERVTVRPITFSPVSSYLLTATQRQEREVQGDCDHLFMSGTVVYVHPKHHWYTVEFDTFGGKIRESFHFMDTKERVMEFRAMNRKSHNRI